MSHPVLTYLTWLVDYLCFGMHGKSNIWFFKKKCHLLSFRARSLNFFGRRGRSLESILITCWKEHTPVCDWKQVIKSGQGYETQVTSTFPWILESQIIINILLTLFYKKVKMITKSAMDTGNFSYLCPDLFGIFRNSHRLQCTHCARCDFQNLLKNIRLYDPKNLRNAL